MDEFDLWRRRFPGERVRHEPAYDPPSFTEPPTRRIQTLCDEAESSAGGARRGALVHLPRRPALSSCPILMRFTLSKGLRAEGV